MPLSLSLSLSLSHGGMNRKCLCFISGVSAVGMLMTASVNASDGGSKIDYGREWNPYVTVRGGWLFGKAKYNDYVTFGNTVSHNIKKSIKNAWSGSAELGMSCDDRFFVGLELGYFTGKMKDIAGGCSILAGANRVDMKWKGNGGIENYFGACNVTLRHDLNDRAFLYGGVGAGIARSRIHGNFKVSLLFTPVGGVAFTRQEGGDCGKSKWRFLGQAFAGLGVYLNESWQLTAGYRLRYVPGSFEWCETLESGQKWSWKVKQDIIHAAEVGLTYQF